MRKTIRILEVANGFYSPSSSITICAVDDQLVFVFTDSTDLAAWVTDYFKKPAPPAPLSEGEVPF